MNQSWALSLVQHRKLLLGVGAILAGIIVAGWNGININLKR
jgi:hypothetical protein